MGVNKVTVVLAKFWTQGFLADRYSEVPTLVYSPWGKSRRGKAKITFRHVWFDALPWLRGASAEEIVTTYDAGLYDDFCFFNAAKYMRDFSGTLDNALTFCERYDLRWYCRIKQVTARNWLLRNRPDVHKQVLPVMRRNRQKALVDERTEGVEWYLRQWYESRRE